MREAEPKASETKDSVAINERIMQEENLWELILLMWIYGTLFLAGSTLKDIFYKEASSQFFLYFTINFRDSATWKSTQKEQVELKVENTEQVYG